MSTEEAVAEYTFQDIHILGELMKGAVSTVYEAKIPSGEFVALKKPKITDSGVIGRFFNEAEILGKMRHPNVLPLVAVVKSPPNYAFALKFINRGTLESVIHVEMFKFSWPIVLNLALQFAKGMEFLHSKTVLHRDLKSSNLLVDDDFHLYIADFDMAAYEAKSQAQEMESGRTRKGRNVGTLVTMAPEIMTNSGTKHDGKRQFVYTRKADVYAFGVTINEMSTGVMPYADRFQEEVNMHTVLNMNFSKHTLGVAIVRDGLRPVLTTRAPAAFSQLIESSWSANIDDRSEFPAIVAALESLGPDDFMGDVEDDEATQAAAAGAGGGKASGVAKTNYFLKRGANDPTAKALEAKIKSTEELTRLEGAPEPLWVSQPNSEGTPSATEGCPADYRAVVVAGSNETCGRRGPDSMEDAHCIVRNFGGRDDATFIGVFDGHGGPSAAQFSARYMPHRVLQMWGQTSSPAEAMQKAFYVTNEAYCESGPEESGCTALGLLVQGRRMTIGNAGDCRAVLCRSGKAVPVTNDHTPAIEAERKRIEGLGGAVEQVNGSWRVNGRMAVSRAIGDKPFKPFISAEPEITTVDLTPEDHFVVIACDGIWDVLTNEEVVQMILDTVKEPTMVAKRIVMEAYMRNATDNLTVVVAFLRPVETVEQVYGEGSMTN